MVEERTGHLSDPSVADEVFSAIAVLCACRMPGVVGVAGLPVDRVEAFLREGEPVRGVKVTSTDEDVALDICVEVSDQIPIPQIAASLQAEVKQWVEDMTGHTVNAVNVTVDDIRAEHTTEETLNGPVDITQSVGV